MLGVFDQGIALFGKPTHAASFLQLFYENRAEFVQVECVVDGVFAHFERQRSRGPVGTLVFFLEFVAEVFAHQVRKAQVFFAQNLCREHGIENLLGRESVCLPQQSQVVVGAVENERLHGAGLEQRGKVKATQRVHNVVVLADGNLDQAKTGGIMVHGIRLGIDGGHFVQLQIREQIRQRFFAIYQYVFFVLQHLGRNVIKFLKTIRMTYKKGEESP